MPPPKMLPKPYAVGANIAHLERVRPLAAAVGISLDKAAKAEGNLATPMGSGPRGNPAILRRIGLKVKPAKPKIDMPKLKALSIPHAR